MRTCSLKLSRSGNGFASAWQLMIPISISAISSQLPCFGVQCHSNRSAGLRASSGWNALYSGAAAWVFRSSVTRIIFSALGYSTSDVYFKIFAKSIQLRVSVTTVPRLPAWSTVRHRQAGQNRPLNISLLLHPRSLCGAGSAASSVRAQLPSPP